MGRYVVLERLGAGGMGVVYTAFDPELDRKVALKLLHAEPTGGTEGSSGRARLIREAQSIARISHPNVIAVHDVGTFGDRVFVTMEYVSGQTLREWLEDGHAKRDLVAMFIQAGRGLAAAHAAGVIHRDFKPDNVLIGEDGRARVLDFGLARAPAELRVSEDPETEDPTLPSTLSSGSIDIPLTQTGAIMGTPAYMAPEQHLRAEVDARSDQFAFCVALWEALFKQRPFGGESMAALAFQVAQGKIQEPPKDANVPAFIRRILERGLSRKKEDRFRDMPALLHELGRDPGKARRRWFTIGAAVAAVAVASGLAYYGGEKQAGKVCSGADEKLAGVWDAERRKQAQQAFGASDLAYAKDSWDRVSLVVDTYADSWKSSYVDACEATRLRGEQSEEMLDLRMACLDDRRRDLAAMTGLLAAADKDVIVRSVKLSHGLPELGPCSDREQLARGVDPPESDIAEQVADLKERISQLNARYNAGKYKEAIEEGQELVEEARELGYRPVIAEALRLYGDASESADDLGLDEQREAFLIALEVGHDELATKQAFSIAYLYGADLEKFEEAENWLAIGESLATRTGKDPTQHGSAVNTRAVMASHQGKDDEARKGFEQLIEIARKPDQPRHQLATSIGNLGSFLAGRGELSKARQLIAEAVEVGTEVYGSKHPALLNWKANLGAISIMEGDLEAGRVHLEDVLGLQEEVFGEESPSVANTLGNLAIVYRRMGDEPKAERMHRRTLAIREKSLGPEHPSVSDAMRNLASAIMEQGRHEEALEILERALAISTKAFGPDHANVSDAHGGMAQVLAKMDRHDEALEHAKLCLDIIQAKHEDEHSDLLEPLIIYGVRLNEVERWKDARAALERAVKIAETAEGDPRLLADARFALAKSLVALRKNVRAKDLAQVALDYYASQGETEDDNRKDVEKWLAQNG